MDTIIVMRYMFLVFLFISFVSMIIVSTVNQKHYDKQDKSINFKGIMSTLILGGSKNV